MFLCLMFSFDCQESLNPLNAKVIIIKSSQLIGRANQLTMFYMVATLAFNELKSLNR